MVNLLVFESQFIAQAILESYHNPLASTSGCQDYRWELPYPVVLLDFLKVSFMDFILTWEEINEMTEILCKEFKMSLSLTNYMNQTEYESKTHGIKQINMIWITILQTQEIIIQNLPKHRASAEASEWFRNKPTRFTRACAWVMGRLVCTTRCSFLVNSSGCISFERCSSKCAC